MLRAGVLRMMAHGKAAGETDREAHRTVHGAGHGEAHGEAHRVVLRPAERSDLDAVERLLETAQLPTLGVEDALGELIVAEAEREIVGAVGLEVHGRDGVLRSLVVGPVYRGRGLGARLTERVLEAARRQGLRRVYLLTTTAEDYFPSFGFERIRRAEAPSEVQRSVEFAEACPASAVAMVLEIT